MQILCESERRSSTTPRRRQQVPILESMNRRTFDRRRRQLKLKPLIFCMKETSYRVTKATFMAYNEEHMMELYSLAADEVLESLEESHSGTAGDTETWVEEFVPVKVGP